MEEEDGGGGGLLAGVDLIETMVFEILGSLLLFVISVEMDEEDEDEEEQKKGAEENETTVGVRRRTEWFDFDPEKCL